MFGPILGKNEDKVKKHDGKCAADQQTIDHPIDGGVGPKIDLKPMIYLFTQQIPLTGHKHHIKQH